MKNYRTVSTLPARSLLCCALAASLLASTPAMAQSSNATLRGHTLALQNASSTSGYLLPVLELLRNGIACDVLLSADDTPARGQQTGQAPLPLQDLHY